MGATNTKCPTGNRGYCKDEVSAMFVGPVRCSRRTWAVSGTASRTGPGNGGIGCGASVPETMEPVLIRQSSLCTVVACRSCLAQPAAFAPSCRNCADRGGLRSRQRSGGGASSRTCDIRPCAPVSGVARKDSIPVVCTMPRTYSPTLCFTVSRSYMHFRPVYPRLSSV